jgi:hypothetical protein
MAKCSENEAKYIEQIETFTFRDSDGITIPKSVREEAYTLAVDIVIVSTDREVYKNYTTTPAEGFYGNATLVMQDFCERKIPINMPRQRLYYGRVVEAFEIWQSMVDWSYFQSYMQAIGESLLSLGTALGANGVPSINECCFPPRAWVELPLREVYVKTPFGTQYKLEISWYKPVQIVDACGKVQNGKSKQTDGSKDNGLPSDGVQPSVAANPNSPFAGLPPASTDAEQGAFANSKAAGNLAASGGLDRVDPKNKPVAVGAVWWIEFQYYSLANPYGDTIAYLENIATSLDSNGNAYPLEVVEAFRAPISAPCGGGTSYTQYIFKVKGVEIERANWKNNYTWNAVIRNGSVVPPTGTVSTIPNFWCA